MAGGEEWAGFLSDLGLLETRFDDAVKEGEEVVRELMTMSKVGPQDFQYVKYCAQGCNAIVVFAKCTKRDHPFPDKVYAIKVMYNMHALEGDAIRRVNRKEFELLRDLWELKSVVRLWHCFMGTIPPSLRALFPKETAELIWGDGLGGGPNARENTWFAVFDAHTCDLASYRRTLLPPGSGILEFSKYLPLAKMLLRGLLDIQGKGVLHRDLKLNNVLVKHDGTLCICDFGEAQKIAPGWPYVLTRHGDQMGGNIAHLAPEIRKEWEAFDARARARIQQGGDPPEVELDYTGQAPFETGVILCELAINEHPVAEYGKESAQQRAHAYYKQSDVCAFTPELMMELEAKGYPLGIFLDMIRGLTHIDPGSRMTVAEAIGSMEVLEELAFPKPKPVVKPVVPQHVTPIGLPSQSPVLTGSPSNWTCSCGFVNHSSMTVCDLCGKGKFVPVTVTQTSQSPACDTCGRVIPTGTRCNDCDVVTVPTMSWRCIVCAVVNDADNTACELCMTERPTVKPVPLLPVPIPIPQPKCASCGAMIPSGQQCEACKRQPWICPACTFVNHAVVIECGACTAKKPTLIPPTLPVPRPPVSTQLRTTSAPVTTNNTNKSINSNTSSSSVKIPIRPTIIPQQPQPQPQPQSSTVKRVSWKCSTCSFHNTDWADMCSNCAAERPDDQDPYGGK